MKELLTTMMKDYREENFTTKEVVMAHMAVIVFFMILGFVGWLENLPF